MLKGLKRREIILASVGIALLFFTVSFLFYSIDFSVNEISQAVQASVQSREKVVRFNFDGLKTLGIIKQ